MPTIEDVLEREDIRKIDGRWSGGFVDLAELESLVKSGKAETYVKFGFTFVRKAAPKLARKSRRTNKKGDSND